MSVGSVSFGGGNENPETKVKKVDRNAAIMPGWHELLGTQPDKIKKKPYFLGEPLTITKLSSGMYQVTDPTMDFNKLGTFTGALNDLATDDNAKNNYDNTLSRMRELTHNSTLSWEEGERTGLLLAQIDETMFNYAAKSDQRDKNGPLSLSPVEMQNVMGLDGDSSNLSQKDIDMLRQHAYAPQTETPSDKK